MNANSTKLVIAEYPGLPKLLSKMLSESELKSTSHIDIPLKFVSPLFSTNKEVASLLEYLEKNKLIKLDGSSRHLLGWSGMSISNKDTYAVLNENPSLRSADILISPKIESLNLWIDKEKISAILKQLSVVNTFHHFTLTNDGLLFNTEGERAEYPMTKDKIPYLILKMLSKNKIMTVEEIQNKIDGVQPRTIHNTISDLRRRVKKHFSHIVGALEFFPESKNKAGYSIGKNVKITLAQ